MKRAGCLQCELRDTPLLRSPCYAAAVSVSAERGEAVSDPHTSSEPGGQGEIASWQPPGGPSLEEVLDRPPSSNVTGGSRAVLQRPRLAVVQDLSIWYLWRPYRYQGSTAELLPYTHIPPNQGIQHYNPIRRPHWNIATVLTICFFSGPESNIGTHIVLSSHDLNIFHSLALSYFSCPWQLNHPPTCLSTYFWPSLESTTTMMITQG